ncbi:galectin-4-like, partial [Passer montanus]|uniref:galectin-4-like n=1 Tax=Passer montanus TaxID=9160 RepID=UPI0019608AE0
ILVNGTFYEEFPHRLPPEQVTAVNVDGDLELHSASVLGGTVRPQKQPAPQKRCIWDFWILVNGTFYEEFPHRLPPEQVTAVNVDGDLELHSASVLGGTPVPFIATIPGGLVPKKTVIIKGFVPHHANRYRGPPKTPLSIRCGNHRFKVFVEGQRLFDFHHRVPAGPHVDVLEIEGDVVLSYVHF